MDVHQCPQLPQPCGLRRHGIHHAPSILDLCGVAGIDFVLSLIISFLIRASLVGLFLPFSALDKLLNTRAAVEQARGTVHSKTLACILIGTGLLVEVVMSAAILTGFFDRLAAVILAGYCAVTALLWKQFWNTADFRLKGPSKGRDVFWDFLKNFAVAGGFLILATGGTAYGVSYLVRHPLSSSHPYSSLPLDQPAPSVQVTDPAGVSP
jgi:putative oxidoreductase